MGSVVGRIAIGPLVVRALVIGPLERRGLGFGALERTGLEVGWLVARPSWGRGFASEAAHAAVEWARDGIRVVNVAPGFTRIGDVVDGCSQLLLDVFGEEIGRHARTTHGAAELPNDYPVAIDLVIAA